MPRLKVILIVIFLVSENLVQIRRDWYFILSPNVNILGTLQKVMCNTDMSDVLIITSLTPIVRKHDLLLNKMFDTAIFSNISMENSHYIQRHQKSLLHWANKTTLEFRVEFFEYWIFLRKFYLKRIYKKKKITFSLILWRYWNKMVLCQLNSNLLTVPKSIRWDKSKRLQYPWAGCNVRDTQMFCIGTNYRNLIIRFALSERRRCLTKSFFNIFNMK